jgi:hypothetical protein
MPKIEICCAMYETFSAVASAVSVIQTFRAPLDTGFPLSSFAAAASSFVPAGSSGFAAALLQAFLLLTGIGFLVLTLGGARFARTRPRLRPQVSQSRECSQRRPSFQSTNSSRPGFGRACCCWAFGIVLAMMSDVKSAVDLYWLPLGAGGHSVRLNGKAFEYIVARLHHRDACDLYHSALVVEVPEGCFVIEQAPVRDGKGAERGVVAEGPVGSRWARSLRIFRYEIRRWRDGVIPDVDEAVESPQRLTQDLSLGRRLLELVSQVPTPVWGRDELQAGEMWNSNSLTSWLIASSGLAVESVRFPAGGRAPGWHAGLVVARRQQAREVRSEPIGAAAVRRPSKRPTQ